MLLTTMCLTTVLMFTRLEPSGDEHTATTDVQLRCVRTRAFCNFIEFVDYWPAKAWHVRAGGVRRVRSPAHPTGQLYGCPPAPEIPPHMEWWPNGPPTRVTRRR